MDNEEINTFGSSLQDSSPEIVRKGILELYLNVKIRSAEEVSLTCAPNLSNPIFFTTRS